jgi:hypothetical protein
MTITAEQAAARPAAKAELMRKTGAMLEAVN